jgi:serine/threonine protein kinase
MQNPDTTSLASDSNTKRKNPMLEQMRSKLKANLFAPPPEVTHSPELSLSTDEGKSNTTTSPEISNASNAIQDMSMSNGSISKKNGRENFEDFRNKIKISLFGAPTPPVGTTTPPLGEIDFAHYDSLDSATFSQSDVNELAVDRDTQMPNKISSKSANSTMARSQKYEEIKVDTKSSTVYHPKSGGIFNHSKRSPQEIFQEIEEEQDPDIHFINDEAEFALTYELGEFLGEGTTGTVKKCHKVHDDTQLFAVKIVDYKGDNEILKLIVKEFKNHKKLNHKNIIKVYEMYIEHSRTKIFTIMELADCREMFDVIHSIGKYSEATASSIFLQILTAIHYLHSQGVCHRDLKPNNILVSDDGTIVKIADFNVSKFIENKSKKLKQMLEPNFKMWTYTGTVAFIAPEVFNETEYGPAVDMWSAGVILYTMLCGFQPFQAEYLHDLIELIKEAKYEFPSEPWDGISHEAKDLVTKCLRKNATTRYDPWKALTHPWISHQGKVSSIPITATVTNLVANVRRNARGASIHELFSRSSPSGRRDRSVTVNEIILPQRHSVEPPNPHARMQARTVLQHIESRNYDEDDPSPKNTPPLPESMFLSEKYTNKRMNSCINPSSWDSSAFTAIVERKESVDLEEDIKS